MAHPWPMTGPNAGLTALKKFDFDLRAAFALVNSNDRHCVGTFLSRFSGPGMRIISWTGLPYQAQTFSVFNRAESAKGELDSLLVVLADVRVKCLDEVFHRRALPVARVEQFSLQSAEESFARCIVR